MKFFMHKKIILSFVLMLSFLFASTCFAEIERTVEPFSKAVTYSSKYSFSDSQRNMHSISLVRTIKPLIGSIGGKTTETDTYFLLNFTLPQGVTLGDYFTIQVTQRHTNALPLTPYLISGIGYSSVPTARTGHKELLDMTKAAIERGEELTVRVDFSRSHGIYTIPAETVQEWARLLKINDINDETYMQKPEDKTEENTEQVTENKTAAE